ncbi:MAG: hypothetical protein LBF51_08355 [Zoogloeaceae bacterium]|jgi:hypothetical protein|nr:hypothetical protein [Zoogloeaceae bacterium]
MAVLDAFYFLFEADARKLEQGLEDAERTAEKTKEKISGVDKKAQEMGKTLKSTLSNLARLYLGAKAIATFREATLETIRQNVELGKQAAQLRVNVEALQAWHGAFASAGSSAETINGLFARMGQRTRDPEARIMRIADRMKQMGEYGQRRFGKMLGLDAEAIALMSQGSAKIEELLKKERELGVVTAAEIEASKKVNEEMRVAIRLFQDLKNRVTIAVLPAVKWLTQGFQQFIRFLREHQPFVKAFVIGIAAGITALFLPAVIKAIAVTSLWLLPFLKIAAAAAALALIIDDIVVYMRGGDSMLGRWAEKFPAVKRFAEGLRNVIDALLPILKRIGDFIGGLFMGALSMAGTVLEGWGLILAEVVLPWFHNLLDSVDAFFALFKGNTRLLMAQWEKFCELIKNIFGFAIEIGKAVGGLMGIGGGSEVFEGGKSAPVNRAKATNPALANNILKGRQIVSQAGKTPLVHRAPGVAATAAQNRTAINKTNTVNIQAVNVQTQATDAEGISKGINQGLEKQLSGALNQFDDGVAA